MPGEMSDENQLTVSIDQMIKNLSPRPENPSIYRVNDILRRTNEQSYNPRVVSIGPFHRDKEHLKDMEEEKKRYLKLLLQSREESSVDRYVKKIKDLENRARKCYSEPIALGHDEFVEMLLLDGIFILEFLRNYIRDTKDAIFDFEHVRTHVLHDLVLFENQIPFFIIKEMFILTQAEIFDGHPELINGLIMPLVLRRAQPALIKITNLNADHLLGLIHQVNCYSFEQMVSRRQESVHDMENINSATELKETAIRFKKQNDKMSESWLDIIFKNKKLYIPILEISDVTDSLFRNMIAYEYNLPRNRPKYITDYMFFLHCLIHAPKDAKLLRQYGIISNWLGGDEMVYHLINQLGSNVLTSAIFSYTDVFYDINQHCERRRNRWIAILRRDYFNSPWKVISLVAGFVLLGVGIVQMVFAILSYLNDKEKGS